MKNCILAAGVALGGSVILCGCGGDDADEATTTAPTTAPGYNPTDVATVWDNHFSAFATFDVDKIMLDYDETSRISVFNDHCAGGVGGTTNVTGLEEHTGTAAIRAFFIALFAQLENNLDNVVKVGPLNYGSNTSAPSVLNEAPPNGNVFLTWATENTASDIPKATDTFSFRDDGGKIKIWKQNIVTTEATKTCTAAQTLPDPGTGPVAMGWDNHFSAFAEKNVSKILLDYTETSIVQVWDNTISTPEAYTKHTGLTEIQGMFEELFAAITDAGDGVAPLLVSVNEDYQDVFLVWRSNSHPKATDSFAFSANGKITRQNIVVETPSSPAAQVMV